jgi:transcriptional regulator with XRE-family HTH domain
LREDKSLELLAFGRALRNLRKEKKLTQEQLSDTSGIDRSYISELENGEKAASFLTIVALTRALKVSTVDLMGVYEEAVNCKNE